MLLFGVRVRRVFVVLRLLHGGCNHEEQPGTVQQNDLQQREDHQSDKNCSNHSVPPEKWAKENPVETNKDRVLKLFPNAVITANGVFDLCPKVLDAKYNCIGNYVSKDGMFERDCLGCKSKFWNSEYKAKQEI